MMKHFLPMLLALLLILPGYSQDDLPSALKAGRYTNYFDTWDEVLKSPNDVVIDLTDDITVVDFLFDTFASFDGVIDLKDISFGTPTPIRIGLILGINRTVINNRRADKSFTVLDTFKIGVQPSFYYSTGGVTVGAAPYVYFEILDIRQVVPARYQYLNPVKFYFEKLKKKIKKEEDDTPGLTKIAQDNELYFNFLPRIKKVPGRDARYGRLLNPISSVFRLPLNHKWIKHIKRDEIISYSITGGVTFSACFGVVGSCNANAPKDFNWAAAGIPLAEIGVFLEGKYQITIMREFTKNKEDNYAKVRVTKVKSTGVKFALGSDRRSLNDQIRKVDGFVIYNMLGGIVNIKPFSITGEFEYSKFLNQTYRFNLNTEKGKEAYDKAVLGRFQLADKYSRDKKGEVIKGKKDAPVLRLLTREEKRKTYRQQSGIDLFLVKFWKNKTIRSSVIKQVDHQGSGEEETYFESLIINRRQMEVFFGLAHLERRTHQFYIHIDDKKFNQEKRPKDTMRVLAKVNHYDRFMTSREYMTYVKEFEDNLGYPGIFPLPPTNREGKWDKLNLGSGSFSYNLEFNWEQIKTLVEYPEKKMWSALAKAFNAEGQGWESKRGRAKKITQRLATYVGTLPLSMAGEKFPKKDDILVANLKRERWKRLKKHLKEGPKKFNEKMAKFFNSGDYGSEMIKLLRVVLPKTQIPYSGTARSKLFNNNKTWAFGDSARFMAPDSAENLEFAEDLIKRPASKGIGTSNLNVHVLGKLYLKISFDLEDTPKKVFFNLDKKETFMDMFERSVETIVVENKTGFFKKPLFKKGHNKILIKISDKIHPLFPLAKKLDLTGKHRTRRYQLNVAASKDGKTFGHYDHSIFGVYPTQSEKFLDGFIEVLRKDENLCLGKAASELILFLGDKKYLVCPENAPKKADGTCVDGFTPYGHFTNSPLKDNLKRRDDWIMKNCPRLGSDQYEKMIIEKTNICQGKTGVMIIDSIGDDPFFVCPKDSLRDEMGFCVSGMTPYQWFSNKPLIENIKERNRWLMKACGAKDF
jgi:hypothetical protein